MKFDVVVGNPPYHYERGRRKIPIYQHFMKESVIIGRKVCLITPDGFLKGGQQLDAIRNWLIETKHLKTISIFKKPIFTNNAVQAAITYFESDKEFDPVQITTHSDDNVVVSNWDWKYTDADMDSSKFATRRIYEKIVEDVRKKLGTVCARPGIRKGNWPGTVGGDQTGTMQDVIPGWAPFGLNTKSYKSNKDNFSFSFSFERKTKILVGEDGVDFYYINPNDDFSYEGSDGRIEYVKLERSEKWKVTFPKAGLVAQSPLKTFILQPGEIFTDKYLCIFIDTEAEAKAAEKYFASKFYRAGIESKMTSWILYRKWHSNVPLQDFRPLSETEEHPDPLYRNLGIRIDWSRSIPEIDQQLYKKYVLSDEEINFIEQRVKDMV